MSESGAPERQRGTQAAHLAAHDREAHHGAQAGPAEYLDWHG